MATEQGETQPLVVQGAQARAPARRLVAAVALGSVLVLSGVAASRARPRAATELARVEPPSDSAQPDHWISINNHKAKKSDSAQPDHWISFNNHKAKKCPGDRVWNECGTFCEPTCDDQNPLCDTVCVPDCQCPFGKILTEAGSDECVEAPLCPTLTDAPTSTDPTCPGDLVWNRCTSMPDGCNPTCETGPSVACNRGCTGACECPPGLVRVEEGGEACVAYENCTTTTATCAGDLVWDECGSACEPSCDQNNEGWGCMAVCEAKCACPKGTIRDTKDGDVCVESCLSIFP